MAELQFSEGHVLPNGNKVRILSYDDGSVRMRLGGGPYVLEEAFLAGNQQGNAILKLVPRHVSHQRQSSPAPEDLRSRAQELLNMMKSAQADDAADEAPGHIRRKHERSAVIAALTVLLMESEGDGPYGGTGVATIKQDSVRAALLKVGDVFHSWDIIELIAADHPEQGDTFPVKVGMHLAKHAREYGIEKHGSTGARGQRWRKVPADGP